MFLTLPHPILRKFVEQMKVSNCLLRSYPILRQFYCSLKTNTPASDKNHIILDIFLQFCLLFSLQETLLSFALLFISFHFEAIVNRTQLRSPKESFYLDCLWFYFTISLFSLILSLLKYRFWIPDLKQVLELVFKFTHFFISLKQSQGRLDWH